ncbi:hypothetical protein NB231_17600, partial [Nitrococcus mobilis Nb-231]
QSGWTGILLIMALNLMVFITAHTMHQKGKVITCKIVIAVNQNQVCLFQHATF